MNIYRRTKKCPGCQGPIFKYVDVSQDTFHLMCGHTKISLTDVNDRGYIRKNVAIPNKKLPCDFKKVYTCYELDQTIEDEYDDILYENMMQCSDVKGNRVRQFTETRENDCVESDDDDDNISDNGYDIEYEEEDEDEDDDESVVSEVETAVD